MTVSQLKSWGSRLLLPGLILILSCVPRSKVDMILTGGTILTMDPYLPPAQALAIVDGRILTVGREVEVRALAGLGTKRIDLKGAVVLPGLTDSHFHLLSFGRSLSELQLAGTASIEEVARMVAAKGRELPPGAWITGRGWDQNDWPVKEFPNRGMLDKVAPDHPVYLRRVDGHALWINTKALVLAGINDETVTPAGGVIFRDAAGHPTGIFLDNAMELVSRVLAEPSREDIRRWLLAAVERCNQVGLTEVHDAGVDGRTLEVITELVDEGRFTMRYYGMLDGHDAQLLERHFLAGPTFNYGGRMTVRTVKFYADGALGSRGAALLADYSDDPGNRGLLVTPPGELKRLIAATLKAGFQPAVHAIGDRANRSTLDIYEAVLQQWPDYDLRPRIEHAQVVSLTDIKRFARLGVIASMQPSHATSDMYWAQDRLGPQRIQGAYAWRRFLEAGVHICGGSDCPVEKEDPLLQIYAARTRQDTTGWPEGGWQADQRLGGLEAARSLTTWAAYAAFEDSRRGKIAPGYDADLTILSRNPLLDPPREILHTAVLMTIVGGEVVWNNRPAWKSMPPTAAGE